MACMYIVFFSVPMNICMNILVHITKVYCIVLYISHNVCIKFAVLSPCMNILSNGNLKGKGLNIGILSSGRNLQDITVQY